MYLLSRFIEIGVVPHNTSWEWYYGLTDELTNIVIQIYRTVDHFGG